MKLRFEKAPAKFPRWDIWNEVDACLGRIEKENNKIYFLCIWGTEMDINSLEQILQFMKGQNE